MTSQNFSRNNFVWLLTDRIGKSIQAEYYTPHKVKVRYPKFFTTEVGTEKPMCLLILNLKLVNLPTGNRKQERGKIISVLDPQKKAASIYQSAEKMNNDEEKPLKTALKKE